MSTLRIINDTHLGAVRRSGTTPNTAFRLQERLHSGFRQLVLDSAEQDLMILGDLFDTLNVPHRDWLAAFTTLHERLSNSPAKVYCVQGNHDAPRASNTLSSFQLLSRILSRMHKNFIGVEQPTLTPHGYIIPHLPNQDLFDQALASVPTCKVLFLHCNYDNNFASQADQSLNLSEPQAQALLRHVDHIVIAHEHQTRKVGNIWLPGNQIASSVSDWLNTDAKRMCVIEGGQPRFEEVARAADEFAEVDWRDLQETGREFVRVVGTATAEEAAEVSAAISRYRASCAALVITNAVKIATDSSMQQFGEAFESVRAFDVLAALKELLTPEEFAIVEAVL